MSLRLSCRSGNKIVLLQTSVESVPIFALLRLIFADGVDALKAAALTAGVSQDDWDAFVSKMFIVSP
jgi:hypothetical protein